MDDYTTSTPDPVSDEQLNGDVAVDETSPAFPDASPPYSADELEAIESEPVVVPADELDQPSEPVADDTPELADPPPFPDVEPEPEPEKPLQTEDGSPTFSDGDGDLDAFAKRWQDQWPGTSWDDSDPLEPVGGWIVWQGERMPVAYFLTVA